MTGERDIFLIPSIGKIRPNVIALHKYYPHVVPWGIFLELQPLTICKKHNRAILA